jgi:hypothetical protein
MPVPDDLAATSVSATAAWVAAVVALGAAAGVHRLRGTTLAAPAAWCVAAAVFIAAVEIATACGAMVDGATSSSMVRYIASVGALCPTAAVLGAKRPQDRGWQWVVLSLWVVLAVPAGQAWVARAGQLELSGVWRLLLAGLVAMGLLNYLPTRHRLAALIAAGGQTALLAGYLIDVPIYRRPAWRLAGLAAIAAALGLASWRRSAQAGDESTRRWRALRDGWGAFWALRVMHRVNETAELSGWPVRLQWSGFAMSAGEAESGDAGSGDVDERVAKQIEQAMDSLLRRFERLDEKASN